MTCSAALIAGPIRWERQKTGYDVSLDGVHSQLDNVALGPKGTATTCNEPGVWGDGFLVPKDIRPDAVDLRIGWGDMGDGGVRIVRFQLAG